jgi:hypothetical protein
MLCDADPFLSLYMCANIWSSLKFIHTYCLLKKAPAHMLHSKLATYKFSHLHKKVQTPMDRPKILCVEHDQKTLCVEHDTCVTLCVEHDTCVTLCVEHDKENLVLNILLIYCGWGFVRYFHSSYSK